jgi:hypothetical protein
VIALEDSEGPGGGSQEMAGKRTARRHSGWHHRIPQSKEPRVIEHCEGSASAHL